MYARPKALRSPRDRAVALLAAWVALIGCGSSGTRDAGDAAADVPGADAVRDVATGPMGLSVATWNVENLFDSADDPDTFDDVLTELALDTKVEALGRVLRALDTDVIVLQEVENLALLDRLADGPLAGRGYEHRGLEEAGDPRGIDVGFLSRLEVEQVVSHKDELFSSADGSETYGFARDALEVFLQVGTTQLVLITVHLRARTDGAEADEHRLAEALKLGRIIDTRLRQGVSHVLVAGDVNDEPGSPSLEALLQDGRLLDLTVGVPSPDRWTFVFSGNRIQLDYVLATPAMRDVLLAGGVEILHGPEVDAASDHQPVLARFELP